MGGSVFTPKQRNWRAFADVSGPFLGDALASENVKPTLADNTSILRFRVSIAETGGKFNNNAVTVLEYSINQTDWFSLGAAAHWDHADGADVDGEVISYRLLSDSDGKGRYCESAASTVSYPASTVTENDMAIVPTGNVSAETTYYFRTLIAGTAVPLDTAETYPQVLTAAGATAYTIAGSLDAYLKKVFTKTPSVDSLLNAVGHMRTTDLDSLLHAIGLTREASIDAILYAAVPYYLSGALDGYLTKIEGRDVSADALLNLVGDLPRSDNFNRANENPIAGDWQCFGQGNIQLLNNATALVTGSSHSFAVWTAHPFLNDQFVEATITTAAAGMGLVLRGTPATNRCIFTRFWGGVVTICTWAGNYSVKATLGSYSATAGDRWRFEVQGNRYRVFKNGVQFGATAVIDTTIVSGSPGVFHYSGGAWDDWEGGSNPMPGAKIASVDALLNALGFTRTVSIDSLLHALGLTRTSSLDAILFSLTGEIRTLSLDGCLQKLGSVTAETDALLNESGVTKEAMLDAYLRATFTKAASLDADLNEQGIEKTLSLDAILYALTGNTVASSADALLQKLAQTKTVSLDGYLQEGDTKISSLDAYLVGVVLRSVSIDAALSRIGLTVESTIDALLQGLGVTKDVSLDASVLGLVTKTLGLDAILFSETGSTRTLSVDGVLRRLGMTKDASIDSLLLKLSLSGSASVDALLYAARTHTLGLDGYLTKATSAGTSIDAFVKRIGGTQTTEFEALLLRLGVIDVTLLDAFLTASFSRNLSVDGTLLAALTKNVDLDAALLGLRATRMVSLGAILSLSAEYHLAVSLDAWIQATEMVAFSLDAILVGGASYIVEGASRKRAYEGPVRARIYEGPKRKRDYTVH
jgi:hypothetical protein